MEATGCTCPALHATKILIALKAEAGITHRVVPIPTTGTITAPVGLPTEAREVVTVPIAALPDPRTRVTTAVVQEVAKAAVTIAHQAVVVTGAIIAVPAAEAAEVTALPAEAAGAVAVAPALVVLLPGADVKKYILCLSTESSLD